MISPSRLHLKRDLLLRISVTLWLIVCALFLRGYSFGTGNQAEQLPCVLRVLDPNYLTRDWFVCSTQEFGPRGLYSHLLAIPSRVLGVDTAFALLHFACWVLFAWGVGSLVYSLMDRDERGAKLLASAVVAWMFLSWSRSVAGANPWIGGSLTPAEIANTLGVWAIVWWLSGRKIAASLAVLGAGVIHPLIGPLGGLTLALTSWWQERALQREGENPASPSVQKTPFALWFALLGATALPLFLGYLVDKSGSLTPEQRKSAIEILAFERHPWHYVPWKFERGSWAAWSFLLALGIGARHLTGARRVLDGLALTSIAFSLVGWISIKWQPLWLLVKLQPFRMTLWLEFAVFFYIAILLGRRLTSRHRGEQVSAALWLWTSLLIAQNVTSPVRLALCLALLLVAEVALQRVKNKNTFWIPLVVLLLLVFLGRGVAMSLLLWLFLVPAAVFGAYAWSQRDVTRQRIVTAMSAGVAVLLVVALAVPGSRARSKLLSNIHFDQEFVGPLAGVARWAQKNTPPDALFLVPPQENDFRLPARRAIVVNFKTFAWGDKGLIDWRKRLSDVTGNVPLTLGTDNSREIAAKYNALRREQFEALQRKYGFNYAVVNADQTLKWTLVFQTPQWKVYNVPQQAPKDRQPLLIGH